MNLAGAKRQAGRAGGEEETSSFHTSIVCTLLETVSRPKLFLIDSFRLHLPRLSCAGTLRSAADAHQRRALHRSRLHLHNMIRKLRESYRPEYIVAVFESVGPTFRDEEFAEYKANRAGDAGGSRRADSVGCAGRSKRCAFRCSSSIAMKPTT